MNDIKLKSGSECGIRHRVHFALTTCMHHWHNIRRLLNSGKICYSKSKKSKVMRYSPCWSVRQWLGHGTQYILHRRHGRVTDGSRCSFFLLQLHWTNHLVNISLELHWDVKDAISCIDDELYHLGCCRQRRLVKIIKVNNCQFLVTFPFTMIKNDICLLTDMNWIHFL